MGEIGVRKITTISFKQNPFLQRKGQGIICLCSLGKGFACRKSHRFPLTHQPRQERKGQGIELLGESAKRLFFTLLVARSSCNFKFKFSFFSKLSSSFCSTRRLSFKLDDVCCFGRGASNVKSISVLFIFEPAH